MNKKYFLWTEHNLELGTLGASYPLSDCQAVGLFNIRVSYKGNFSFFKKMEL